MKHHYSPDEVNTILERALARKPLPGDMTRDQLVQLAAEVGVTPEELDAAETQVRSQAEPDSTALHTEIQQGLRVASLVIALTVSPVVLFAIFIFKLRLSGLVVMVLSLSIIAFLLLSFSAAVGLKTHGPFNERLFQRWLRRRERREHSDRAPTERTSHRLR